MKETIQEIKDLIKQEESKLRFSFHEQINISLNKLEGQINNRQKYTDKLDTYFSDTMDGVSPSESANDLGLI